MVFYNRPYPRSLVLRTLMEHGYSVTEHPMEPEWIDSVHEPGPELVVVAIDPEAEDWRVEDDYIAVLGKRQVIGIVPDTTTDVANLLDTFVLTLLRDGEVREVFPSQLRALARLHDHQAKLMPARSSLQGLEVDFDRMRAAYDGLPLDLSPATVSVLGQLLLEKGRIVTPSEPLFGALGRRYGETSARMAARQYVRWIRRALELAGGDPDLVVNVRGFGYLLETQAKHPSGEHVTRGTAEDDREPAATQAPGSV